MIAYLPALRTLPFSTFHFSWWLAVSVCGVATAKAPHSELLLPGTTVAYLTVADPPDLEVRWERTQLGQFAADATLDPFIEHLRSEIPRRLGNMEERVGVTLDDMQGVAGGELAWAIVSRPRGRAASVMLVDTAGNAAERDALIRKIDAHLVGRQATKSTSSAGNTQITHYRVPPLKANEEPSTAAYFVAGDLLCVADHRGAVQEIAGRLDGAGEATLSQLEAYRKIMEKCAAEAGEMSPDVRWFVQPFPLVDAMRTIRPRRIEGEDRVQQFREQGFDAIRGAGGFVNVSFDGKHDFIHRTAIYVPPVSGAEAGKKYRLGMNVLKFPNVPAMHLHNWTPRTIARYMTINIDLLHAFDHVGTLFDEIVAGYEGAFDTAMERFENDPFGPKIKFREEIIANLGNEDGARVCLMTDYTLPIDTESERFLAAIEVKRGGIDTLRVAIGKYLEKDGYVKRTLEGREIWEFQPEEEEDYDAVLGNGLFPDEPRQGEGQDRLLTRSAVSVTDDQLFIASDVEFLRLAFRQAEQNEALAESFDYLAVAESLAKLGPKQLCSWSFDRTDEVFRPTYVLLREGKMPESETFFGRLLNELLTTEEEQKNQLLRKQRLEGDKLPAYELARRYFGPSGRSVRTDEDGWLITGVLLNKMAD